MKIYVKNTLTGLVPMYPADLDEKKRLRLGEEYHVEIKRPRNVGLHRKFFALLNLGHQNTQLDMPFEAYRRYMTMKAGFYNCYSTPKGEFFEAQSISFASMDQRTFEDVFDRVMDKIIEDIGTDKEDIMDALVNFM